MTAIASSPTHVARGAGASIRRDPAAPWRHVDVVLLLSVLAVAGFGLLMIHSATKSDVAGAAFFVERQAIFCVIGIVAMFVAAVVDYRVIRDFAPVIFGTTILVLLAVKSPLGSSSKGTQAWFDLGPFQLQPSEFAKLALVVMLAAYAAAHRGELDLRRLGVALGIAAAPMVLVYLQPDLGTALVFVVIVMGMMLVAGAKVKHLAALTLLGVVAVVAVIQVGALKQYQLDRLGAFIQPDRDTQRSAYNLNQSKIAIGSGGLTGKGLGNGPQTNLSYVPEQHTDFIFTVVGEELGFAGSSVLLILFGLVVWRTWRAAALSKDLFGTLVCVGVLSMLVFQVFENAGMTMGIMPITGIPLPLFSYGGSSVIATFIGIGLVLNVHMRRFS